MSNWRKTLLWAQQAVPADLAGAEQKYQELVFEYVKRTIPNISTNALKFLYEAQHFNEENEEGDAFGVGAVAYFAFVGIDAFVKAMGDQMIEDYKAYEADGALNELEEGWDG